MTSRELVVKTLNHQSIPRIPRDLWIPAGDDPSRAEERSEIDLRYPSDIVMADAAPSHGKRSHGKGGKSSLASPAELLDRERFARADQSCRGTSRFVLGWTEVRPFDRLRSLCGHEGTKRLDLDRNVKETRGHMAAVHELACKEIEQWAKTEVDGVVLRDDWAAADALLIAPDAWRELFRPLYRDLCEALHDNDKFVFFHGDGNIGDIFGDLIKSGVDAVHCQLHLMTVEQLAKRYGGQVTFWGGLDRARFEQPGSPAEFRQAVCALRRILDHGSGGVIAQCQWDAAVRLQTIAAYFEHWLAPLRS